MKPEDLMLAGFRRLSVGIMWNVQVMVRGMFIQHPMLRDVVVAGVGCVLLWVPKASMLTTRPPKPLYKPSRKV
jgi:hypothetical protein